MKKTLALAALATCFSLPALADDSMHGEHMKMMVDQMFKDADANNDGTISKSEYMDYEQKKFDKMDTGHDGTLSKDEVLTFKKNEMSMIKSNMGMNGSTNGSMMNHSSSMNSTRSSSSNDTKTNSDMNKQ